ncbi:WD40 repeat-like protein [Hypoxylon fragiforme]|uniref:WD40 repeat-like protein n=1 Tax=Hypoxylon fragiforme TaxID=63214 RepID=UPI0020C65640|nr:WD40 repeat-like protein [Hypoxylon fragiforme]KAI2611395.1 WD40 repeat-like protein [Hypoxylon fragiforme]
MATTTTPTPTPPPDSIKLAPLPPFKPDLYQRAWQSVPHPTLPLLATAHQKSVTVFSLTTLSAHSALTDGHDRSVRSATWRPNLPPHKLCLVTGSFDSTAGLWRWTDDDNAAGDNLEVEVTAATVRSDNDSDSDNDGDKKDWELIIILDGHENEIKSVAFSPSGQYLATCSRDKTVWIWEDVGEAEEDDWETIAVLNEHEADVKAVAWCPQPTEPTSRAGNRGRYSSDVLASASYDNTVRVWREDGEDNWVCVAVLEGHDGTVWGLQWEPKPRPGGKFPRILTWSADCTVRIWTLKEEEADNDDEQSAARHQWGGALSGIPNTMRRSLKEDWACTAILPKAHTRDIYAATWSPETGLVASTGSDGIIAIYREEEEEEQQGGGEDEAVAELDGDDVPMTNGHTGESSSSSSSKWKLISSTPNGHGPYEINHITWCKRYDQGCAPERRGKEEMLVTTGDDGIIRPWQVI